MTDAPRVVIGLPLYNHATTVRESLESLLAQQFDGYRVVAIDDDSTDATADIVEQYALSNARLSLLRNSSRLGMIRNWRRCFEVAVSSYPETAYFAWGSDHDLWDSMWLPRLVTELDEHPEAVFAYPLHRHLPGVGAPEIDPRARFETTGIQSPNGRLRRTIVGASPGNMVYGLYRVESLQRAGVFRTALLPDRLLLTELSLRGEYRQVPETLWCRRHENLFSTARQRSTLFGDTPPWWAWAPWWAAHTVILCYQLVVRGTARPQVGRVRGLQASLETAALSAGLHVVRGLGRWRRRLRAAA